MGRAETGGRGAPGKAIKSGRESQSRRAGGEIEASSKWVRGGSREGDRVEPGEAIDASRRGASEAAVGGCKAGQERRSRRVALGERVAAVSCDARAVRRRGLAVRLR